MKKTYYFYSTRIWIFILLITFLFVSPPILCKEYFKSSYLCSEYFRSIDGFWGFLFFIIQFIISAAISWFLSSNKLAVSINDTSINIDKLSGILPFKNKELLLVEIDEYSFTPERSFHSLKIKLKNRNSIKLLLLDTIINKNKDFFSFAEKFKKTVNKLNEENKTEIYRVLNFYESKQGVYIAYIFGFCIILLIVLLITNQNISNKAAILSAILGGSFYIFQVINFKRKK
jgi:hypothetical protein